MATKAPSWFSNSGRVVRRLEQRHHRAYQSVFGSFVLERAVYGTRKDQKIEYVPLDARLQLPEDKCSYLLQEWDQALAVETPYAQVSATLERILGFSQPVDSLERMNRKMANAWPSFGTRSHRPQPGKAGELVVVTADGKGVPIRRTADQAPIEDHRPKKGPKPNRKKIATLGAVYTIERHQRTPEEEAAKPVRDPKDKTVEKSKRPAPRHKRVRASLARSADGRTEPALNEVFSWMGAEICARDPHHDLPLPCLMDGQGSLWEAANTHLPQDHIVPILDLLHVTPRLWKAAYLFYPGSSELRSTLSETVFCASSRARSARSFAVCAAWAPPPAYRVRNARNSTKSAATSRPTRTECAMASIWPRATRSPPA